MEIIFFTLVSLTCSEPSDFERQIIEVRKDFGDFDAKKKTPLNDPKGISHLISFSSDLGVGTGYFLRHPATKKVYFVTAGHVAKKDEAASVILSKSYDQKLVDLETHFIQLDSKRLLVHRGEFGGDLAIYDTTGISLPLDVRILEVGDAPQENENYFSFGYGGDELQPTLKASGPLRSKSPKAFRTFQNDGSTSPEIKWFEFHGEYSSYSNPGSSGAPLLDANGKWIGHLRGGNAKPAKDSKVTFVFVSFDLQRLIPEPESNEKTP